MDTKDLLASLDAAMAEHALRRLHATLAAHETGSGVYFDSRAWIIAARRRCPATHAGVSFPVLRVVDARLRPGILKRRVAAGERIGRSLSSRQGGR